MRPLLLILLAGCWRDLSTECPDEDLDGYYRCADEAADCNDADPRAHPDAAERCNAADDDCDGAVDDGLASCLTVLSTAGVRSWSDGSAAASCQAYRTATAPHLYLGDTGDGVYLINPTGAAPFRAYCDMTSDGGGWTMCYTERNSMVHVATETAYTGTYGAAGYRSDCRAVPFREVLYVNHDSGQKAWFTRQTAGDVVMSSVGYDTSGSAMGQWTPHGVAAAGNYQLLVCDAGWMWTGLFMSGYTGCWKQCGSWCSDTGTQYFRTDGSDTASYNGVAFAENGHTNVGYKTMSVGVR